MFFNILKSVKLRIQRFLDKVRLKNRSFTIISNNCWGGFVYQRFGIEYQSPTVGCGILDEHYFKFVQNLRYYVQQELVFIDPHESLDYKIRRNRYGKEIDYPVGRLDDVEIWFTHYKSKDDAKAKWQRRCKRINYSNLIIKWSQRNSTSDSQVNQFLALPWTNKIALVAPECSVKSKNVHIIPELTMLNKMGGAMKHPILLSILMYLNI